MWLLELHFAISVLCLVAFLGFKPIFKDKIIENGWFNDSIKGKGCNPFKWLAFFVPLLNILMIVCMFIMVVGKKEDFDKMRGNVCGGDNDKGTS